MAPRIFIFPIVLGAEYLSYMKFTATYAPTFFGYIISVLANVVRTYQAMKDACPFMCLLCDVYYTTNQDLNFSQNFKILFTAKITLISMIKKCLELFWILKSKLVMTYFMFVLLRPHRNDREQFQKIEGRFVDF
jgi:hypothetical protein